MELDFSYALNDLDLLLSGALKTFQFALLTIVFGTVIGLFVGLMRLSTNKFLRGSSYFYISFIRGTPLLVQIFFIYFALPAITPVSFNALTAGAIALSINAGAYIAEIFRAGIQSIDKGQKEAGFAIGFTPLQTMRYIILPQAVKRMLPAFLNQFIISLKDTSLLSVIGILELLYIAQTSYATNFRVFEYLIVVVIIYWLSIELLTQLANWVERRVNQ